MNNIPPAPPVPPQPSVTTSISVMQQLEEGVAPAPVKPKFNKRNTGTLKEIQETPIFGGEAS